MMSKRKSWAGRIGVGILIAAVSSILTVLVVAGEPKPYEPPKPKSSLTLKLGGQTWAKASSEFDRRVKGQFPIGKAENVMTMELRRQGFVRQDWAYSPTNGTEAMAFRSENNMVCNQGAFVYWRTDTSGKIKSIRGVYAELGCL
jgi:hypothetical protein